MKAKTRSASSGGTEELVSTLESRFKEHMDRHPDVDWAEVKRRLDAHPDKLRSLGQMEETRGEPDVVGGKSKAGEFLFVDCSAQSPAGRTSLCYDREALNSRKEFKPRSSAVDLAAEMGVELLTEQQYQELQRFGEFDTKSSSWLRTPPEIRELGGAIFGDRRFGRVFIYHNGAESYYSGRGFRGCLQV